MKSSHVVAAMGLDPDTVVSHLRISLGRETSDEDIDYLLELIPGLVQRQRSAGGSESKAMP